MRRTSTRLSDGRELIYFDVEEDAERTALDRRGLTRGETTQGTLRRDALTDEWIVIAGHRQGRIHLPSAAQCPLCPSTTANLTEIPESGYQVVVFENRFPSFTWGDMDTTVGDDLQWGAEIPAHGRCEVVAYTSDHEGSIGSLDPEHMLLVMRAWIDRSRTLGELPGIRYVFVFENRGAAVGVTLHHPHGQIYAYPYLPPAVADLLHVSDEHRARTGGSLLESIVTDERADGRRVVAENAHWVAFVPFAARWPYEVQIHPIVSRASLTALTEAEQVGFAELLPPLVRALDAIFGEPFPYMAGWMQAPVNGSSQERADTRLFLRLISNRRAEGKLKFLAGSESIMGAFINDVTPEEAAAQIRKALDASA